ncbi:hypothetical protein NMG60_11007100 [Bertholletia excelsa]
MKRKTNAVGYLVGGHQPSETSLESESTETSTEPENMQEAADETNQESANTDTSNGSDNELSVGDQHSEQSSHYEEGAEEEILMVLYKKVHEGDWRSVKYLLELHPDALIAKISSYGETALHIAVLAGHVKIVEELVQMTPAKELEQKNDFGETALSLAAGGGVTKVAKHLIRKNHNLLGIKNVCGLIPVVVAAQFGHTDMVRFLYYVTQEEDLNPETSDQGAKLNNACIIAQIHDVALDLVKRYPELAIAKLEDSPGGTLHTLATRHSSFPSGTQLTFWQQWIYPCIPVHSPCIFYGHKDIEAHPELATRHHNVMGQALKCLYGLAWELLKFLVPCFKHLHNTKSKHSQILEFLDHISREISTLNHKQIAETELFKAVFKAVEHGIVEFVEETLNAYPDIVWILGENSRNIFLYAVLQRKEKIFNLLHKMGPKKNLIATSLDDKGNTILHHAAMLSPSSHLDHISGAALQMQRELQWFEEVEKVVQPMYREMKNKTGKTARALFTAEHKKLRKEGEKWMKENATSCTVVAALVATVMFTAAFTVPGGYHEDTGKPIFLHHTSFLIFILSDAVSLFASSSSVLMFLGILKSRYTEAEFLVSLPRKLIIGIATLFFSIATMMINFGTTIFIILNGQLSWISIPVILMACVPVMIFVFPQVPLLYEICASTYGPGIFQRKTKGKI